MCVTINADSVIVCYLYLVECRIRGISFVLMVKPNYIFSMEVIRGGALTTVISGSTYLK